MLTTDRDLEYLEGVHPPLGPVLEEMLSIGRSEGVPIALAPKRVVEIGTAIGFSTLWMASALPPGGRIDTIDPDRARTDRARRYWLRAGVTDRVRVINEPALRVLPRLAPGIDFAFIDALKPEYAAYLDALLPKMAPGVAGSRPASTTRTPTRSAPLTRSSCTTRSSRRRSFRSATALASASSAGLPELAAR